MTGRAIFASLLVVVCGWTSAWARNVDLSTVPKRDTVQLTIYNSEDLTLVKETRSITLKKGSNKLQFSWAGTLIDPTSGRTLWTAERSDWNVQTTDARNGPEASGIAARDVARALVDGWQPGGSRSPTTP